MSTRKRVIPIRVRWFGRPTQARLDELEDAIARQVADRVAKAEQANVPVPLPSLMTDDAAGMPPAFAPAEPAPAPAELLLPSMPSAPAPAFVPVSAPAPTPVMTSQPSALAPSSAPASVPATQPSTMTPVPAASSSTPAPPPAPVPAPPLVTPPVPVRRDPVPITPVPTGTARVSDLPRSRFSGLTEVITFAEELAEEYKHGAPQAELVERVRPLTALSIRRLAEAAPPRPGETDPQRKARIDREVAAARSSVKAPKPRDFTGWEVLREEYRRLMLQDLEESWQRHIKAANPAVQSMPAHTLANLWMVNRNQEFLFELDRPRRPARSLDLYTHYRIMSVDEEAAAPGGLSPPVVDLYDLPGGPRRNPKAKKPEPPQLVTARVAEFLRELHERMPHLRWTTYAGHGSKGFEGRGLSVDVVLTPPADKLIPLPGLSKETFWVRERVIELCHALEDTAWVTSFHFRAIYNDFSVARAANEFLVRGSVGFAGDIDRKGGLNYHGGGAVLHVHLDLVPDELVVLTPAGLSQLTK